jgi:hypothetical protein
LARGLGGEGVLLLQDLAQFGIDGIRVLAGLHAADRLGHAGAELEAGGVEQAAHQAGGLPGIGIVIEPFEFSPHRGKGAHEALLVHPRRQAGLASGIFALGAAPTDGKPARLTAQVGACALGAGGARLRVHTAGEEVEDGVTVGAVELVDGHGRGLGPGLVWRIPPRL